MKIENLGAGVFTIDNFLSKQECERYINISEGKIFDLATINAIAGPEINKEIRHNDRVIFDDVELANMLFQRARACLPASLHGW
jgi:hypothetical protein